MVLRDSLKFREMLGPVPQALMAAGRQRQTPASAIALPSPSHPKKWTQQFYEKRKPTKTAAASIDSQTPGEFKWN